MARSVRRWLAGRAGRWPREAVGSGLGSRMTGVSTSALWANTFRCAAAAASVRSTARRALVWSGQPSSRASVLWLRTPGRPLTTLSAVPPCSQGDAQQRQVDPAGYRIAGFHGARVALDEDRLAVLVEVVHGQPAMPGQLLAYGSCPKGGGRVIDAEPGGGAASHSLAGLHAGVGRD